MAAHTQPEISDSGTIEIKTGFQSCRYSKAETATMQPLPSSHTHVWLKRLQQSCGTIYWRQAVLSAPAILIVLAVSLKLDPIIAVIMVGAAFSVGFGAARTLIGRRWGAMAVATLGMALAAFGGSLIGLHPSATLATATLLAAACAALSSYNNDWWWVALQIVIAFLVAGYYPNSFEFAALRGLLVLLGGGLQIAITMLLARLTPASAQPLPPAAATALPGGHLIRFTLASALAVAASFYIAEHVGLKNNYWAAMTVLLVLRPAAHDTLVRGSSRLVGTLAGCACATLLVYAFHDSLHMLVLCLTLASAAAFSMQKAHYALLTSMISASIVFLLAIGHGDPLATTEHRLAATLLGGAMAIVMGRVFRL